MNIKNKTRKYWEIWQNYEEKNLVYRVSLAISGFIIFVLSFSLVWASLRSPLVITVKNGVATKTAYASDNGVISQKEAKVFVTNFVSFYYNWAPETIGNNLNTALTFLDYDLKKESKKRIKEKVYDSKEKKLSQSVYVKELRFDEKSNEVTLLSERIFTISKVKLTSDFKVVFRLIKQKRTKDSPSGLLISRLTEPFENQ